MPLDHGAAELIGRRQVDGSKANGMENGYQKNISTKEMLPIVLATAMWGRHCCHKHVFIYGDNMAVVDIMATKTSKEPSIMHLLRCLHFFIAIFDINLRVAHLAGKLNTTADAISRNSMQILQGTCNIQQHPDPIPSSLWQLLVTMQPD